MKVFLVVFFAALIAVACKKESTGAKMKNSANNSLFARWELRVLRGGLQPYTNFAPGNGNMLQFNADSTYAFYQNNNITSQGTFHIVPNAFVQGPEPPDLIYYDHNTSGEVLFLKNDTLTIGSSAPDGPSYVYVKK